MMMRFPSKNNRRHRTMRTMFLGSALAVLVGIGIFFGFNTLFSSIITTAGVPVWAVRNTLDGLFHNSFELFHSKQTLLARTEELMKENVELLAKVQDRDILAEENVRLQALFDRKPEKKDFVFASIIARPGFFSYDSLVVDAGSKDGITEGRLVYAGEYSIIGTVSEIYDTAARVVLFSNPDQETRVLIGIGSTTPGTALGKGNGNFEIKVPRAVVVKKDDPIRLAADDHIVLGHVGAVTTNPADTFQSILFTLPINVQHITSVLIEKNAQSTH